MIDLNRLQLIQITQFSDSTSYSFIVSYVRQEQPLFLLFPSSQKDSRLYRCLDDAQSANGQQLLLVARKYFDDTEGQRLLSELMVSASSRCYLE